MAKAKAAAAVKIKKKSWYPIIAPQNFSNMVLGETYVTEPAAAVGRIIQANLRDITENMRDQNVYIAFKIVAASGNNLNTDATGYYMTAPSVKKLTRRTSSRMDESFVVVTSDGKNVRIKPVVVTSYKAVRSVCSALRKLLKEHMARDVSKITFSQLLERVVTHQLQTDAKKRLSKITPVKIIEIKVLEAAREGKPVAVVEDKMPVNTSLDDEPKQLKKKKEAAPDELSDVPAEVQEQPEPAVESEEFGEERA